LPPFFWFGEIAWEENMEKAKFIPVREAAAQLGLSKPTISRLIKAGKIPHIRLGSWPMIPASWIDDQLAAAFKGNQA
jgi:excisionase family DNA binding protein